MQESGRGLQLAGTEEGGGGHPPATRSGAGGAGGGESARAAHPCGGGGQPATRAGRHMLQAGVLWWQEEKLIRRRGAQAGWFVACCERGALNCVIDAIGVLGRWQHTHTRASVDGETTVATRAVRIEARYCEWKFLGTLRAAAWRRLRGGVRAIPSRLRHACYSENLVGDTDS
ncbi:hypothetical protein R5R35_011294 [Gryllus longicercus]|uniref:Uncharacterized protein n=1 Tax=Gryllus longicercus TaxID=2509291 RepID=A0AAN9V577_9ORTH